MDSSISGTPSSKLAAHTPVPTAKKAAPEKQALMGACTGARLTWRGRCPSTMRLSIHSDARCGERMFCLASHVQSCLSDDHVLLLDLKRGRYVGIPGVIASRLCRFVNGMPKADHAKPNLFEPTAIPDSALEEDMLREMQAVGMLVHGPVAAGMHINSRVEKPALPLIHGYEVVSAPLTLRHATRFLRACATAEALLRWCSMETLSARLRRHAERYPPASPDSHRLRELVATFLRMRPFLYTSYDACLFNSLAMHEFLLHYGLRTQLIIGVTAKPFKAHCWLQVGATVVNDDPSSIWRFTPILSR
jgi:hypothetical protein